MGIGFYDQIGDTFGETKAAVSIVSLFPQFQLTKAKVSLLRFVRIYKILVHFRRLCRATVGTVLHFCCSDPVVCMQYIDERPSSLPADQQLNSPYNESVLLI